MLIRFSLLVVCNCLFFFFKQKTAYEMRISDWSSDVCSSELTDLGRDVPPEQMAALFKQITAAAKASGEAPFEQKSIAQGAATSVWAAAVAEADAIGGRYCEDCQVGEIDRKSVVEGKRVAVRLGLGGGRIIKKKKTIKQHKL